MKLTASPVNAVAPRRRRGFTLMELLLVLAVIVAIMSIAAPALRRPLFSVRIKKAGEQVRAAFGRARIMAMKTGHIVSFRFQTLGGGYIIQPIFSNTDITEIGMEEAMGGGTELIEDNLPEPMMFAGVQGVTSTRDAFVQERLKASPSNVNAAQLSPPILFYPDGTCSSAEVLVLDDEGQQVAVRLRGLTGTTTMSEIMAQ